MNLQTKPESRKENKKNITNMSKMCGVVRYVCQNLLQYLLKIYDKVGVMSLTLALTSKLKRFGSNRKKEVKREKKY